jgi:Sulfotransferase family
MILSHRHRFILLQPWKTASSTAHLRLARYDESPYSRFYDYNPHLQRVVHQHITFAEFAALPESREGYFTGVFVRNPYDRVYSGFVQLQRDIQEQPAAAFPNDWIKALVMRQLADNEAQLAAGEFDFDKWFALVEEHQIYEVGRNSSFPLHPAHYWTGIDRELRVDFIGKVECFERDFDAFCGRAGIEPGERASTNVSDRLPEPQSPGQSRYANRMNAASISKIESLFDEDFDLFGYEKHSS